MVEMTAYFRSSVLTAKRLSKTYRHFRRGAAPPCLSFLELTKIVAMFSADCQSLSVL
jgi:hypothetical protein